jgi:hypothetical protein
MRRAFLISLAAASAGCLGPTGERGTPLYTAGATPVPVSGVATLDFRLPAGYRSNPWLRIKSVDGRDVSTLIAPFELLPGCHVVEAGNGLPGYGTKVSAFRYAVGPEVFTINMRPGHEYTVQEEPPDPSRTMAIHSIHAIDRDPSGHVEEIPAAATDADLRLCRASTSPPS